MEPYIGEIRMFAGNFAPVDWLLCDGSSVSILQYQALFSLIGTTYGGDGVTTFKLPDLRSRVPIQYGTNQGSTYTLGQQIGTESVSLLTNNMPSHPHGVLLPVNNEQADASSPMNAYWGNSGSNLYSSAPTPDTFGGGATTGVAGSGLPHDNVQPYLCLNFIISMYGLWPSSN